MSSDGPRYPEYPEQDSSSRQQPPSPTPAPSHGQTPPPPSQLPAPRPTNPKAIWAMVLGIVGTVLCCLFAGVPAIILGAMARKEIAASGGAQEGRGMATAGFVLGIVGVVLSIVAVIFFSFVVTSSEFQEGFQEGYRESAG